MMHFKIPCLLKTFGLLAVAVLLSSCGGGGGGGTTGTGSVAAAGTGSVGILLTDKPASLDMFSGVMLSVTKVEFFNADSGKKVTAYSGKPRGPFNLLKLRNESKPLAFYDSVPSGRYCKIRLTLDDMWLEFKDESPDYHPKLPGNNKLDLNARDCFYVSDNKIIYIQLDMDMSKSIHVVKRGNRDDYNFRPVVFIDVVGQDFRGKLVRLEGGTVEDVNQADRTVLLCSAIPAFYEGAGGLRDECVKVHIGRDTSAFDNEINDGNTTAVGEAIPLADVFAPERVGSGPVTVVGYFRTNVNSVYAARKKDKDNDSNSDSNSDSDSESNDNDYRYLDFDALVVEFGEFLSLDGEVSTTVEDDSFEMAVLPGQGYSSTYPLRVELQPAPAGGNGTKILSKSGAILTSDDIKADQHVTADGVLTARRVFLNSALIIVDTDALNKDIATGVINRVGSNSLLLEADSFVCEPGVGPGFFVVNFGDSTDVYEVTESSLSIEGEFVGTDELAIGQIVDISGECDNNELLADTIVIRP